MKLIKLKNEGLIGISEETRSFVVRQLFIILSDEYILFTKLFKFHWNIQGPHFGPLHAFFENGYKILFRNIDETAERCTQLGFCSIGTLSEFISLTRLKENPGENYSAIEMINLLCNDFESVIIQIREIIVYTESNYKDAGTSNFLTDKMQEYEKYYWILRSHRDN